VSPDARNGSVAAGATTGSAGRTRLGAEEMGGRYRVLGTDQRSAGGFGVVAAFDTILERTVDLVLLAPAPLSERIAERSRIRALLRDGGGRFTLDVVDGPGRTVVVVAAGTGEDAVDELARFVGGGAPVPPAVDRAEGKAADRTPHGAASGGGEGGTDPTTEVAVTAGGEVSARSAGSEPTRPAPGSAWSSDPGTTARVPVAGGAKPRGEQDVTMVTGRTGGATGLSGVARRELRRTWPPARIVVVAAAAAVGVGVGDLLASLLH
jgi:hypothetical protein